MTIYMQRPVGAPADVKELEYIAALQQTAVGAGIRRDGSVSVTDVRRQLVSRHGIRRSRQELAESIFCQLAGSLSVENNNSSGYYKEEGVEKDHSEDCHSAASAEDMELFQEECSSPFQNLDMDLVQQLAMLFIPELLQIRHDQANLQGKADSLIDLVLTLLLEEAGLPYGVELTRESLQTLLQAHGEDEWPDETLEAMMDACRTQDDDQTTTVRLDSSTFLAALTADTVKHYPLDRKETSTTHYQDALAHIHEKDGPSRPHNLHRITTLSTIDNTADTYRSFGGMS